MLSKGGAGHTEVHNFSGMRGDASVGSKTTTAETVEAAPSLWASKFRGIRSSESLGRDPQIEDSLQALAADHTTKTTTSKQEMIRKNLWKSHF